ncbi:MAG TPA: tRNA (adenosine(37)-N6)-dimethylallyltransferase MiaA [Candidatus Dormibacteraeota bacterium]|nr:tRNA (adenosine(37)-N6)-dimethylallyltransferase MiaA [Candidatus Dormibacteraeota bacterium]
MSEIIALVGPTGSGKTSLSLELAERWRAEIVNCDSRQVFRGLDIGTAKPTAAERAQAPHHLFDVVEPDEPFDAARYAALARVAIAAIRARGRRVVVVGGTGLYLKALRFGLFAGPPADAALRAQLLAEEAAAPGALHARLARVDAASAARLHARDRVRLVRALEVFELTGRRLSDWHAAHAAAGGELAMRVVGLHVPRSALYARLDARCEAMLAAGLLDEIRALWARGHGPELPALRSIGYRQMGAHLRGEVELATALAAMQRATRQFAKRQVTWFRADPTVQWVAADAGARALA